MAMYPESVISPSMKRFDIEFDVHQKFTYSGTIDAETPEEAIRLFRENPDAYQTDEDTMQESYDDLDTVICIGERIRSDIEGSHLERFKQSIKIENDE